MAISSNGEPIAEAELEDEDPQVLIAEAGRQGAELLWIHANRDLSQFGFRRARGYVRLFAEDAPTGSSFELLKRSDYARLVNAGYAGLWGHKQVPSDARPPEGAVVIGLRESDVVVGLCTVFPAERTLDAPGVVPAHRRPDSYVEILLAACAVLGPGPASIDSWGDDPEVIRAYRRLGFQPIDQVQGWELRLRASEPAPRP